MDEIERLLKEPLHTGAASKIIKILVGEIRRLEEILMETRRELLCQKGKNFEDKDSKVSKNDR